MLTGCRCADCTPVFQPIPLLESLLGVHNDHCLPTRRLCACTVASTVIWEPTGSPQYSQAVDVPTEKPYSSQYFNFGADRKPPMLTSCQCADWRAIFYPVQLLESRLGAHNAHSLPMCQPQNYILSSTGFASLIRRSHCSHAADAPTLHLYSSLYFNWGADWTPITLIVCRRADCAPVH